MLQYTQTLDLHFLVFILIQGFAGMLGGFGSILLSSEYSPNRWIKDENGNKVKLIFGSIKEPLIGILGGILVSLPLVGSTSAPQLLSLALLTGFSSSKFLKNYIEKKTNEVLSNATNFDDLNIHVIEDPTVEKSQKKAK